MAAAVESLEAVALGISAYRSDVPVLELLKIALAPGQPRFGAVIVVDSLGSGEIASVIEANGWPVTYINAQRNLGGAAQSHMVLCTQS